VDNEKINTLVEHDGSFILGISETAYRKRLSRARGQMHDFLSNGCGLLNDTNPCKCERLVGFAVKSKWIKPENLLFATHSVNKGKCLETLNSLEETDEMKRVAELYKKMPEFTAPEKISDCFRALLHSTGAG